MPVYYPTPQQYLIPLYYTTPPASIYHPYHRWSAGIQHPQAVAQAQAPVVVYATSRPPAQTYAPSYTSGPPVQTYQPPYPQRRGLLVGTSNPPTWNNVPSQNHILYSTSTVPRPVAYNTKYIPSLNWPNLGPHAPQGLQPGVPTTQGARRRVRIAFHLRKRIPRKEGVPLSFLLHEDVSALKSLLEKPYEHVLPHGDGNWKTASSIALRFWSPVHPYPVREYAVPVDSRGHNMTRLALALHVAKAYKGAASSVPESGPGAPSKNAVETPVIGPRTMSLGYVWLASLRGTEREGVFDVGVQHHGLRASAVW